MKECIKCHVKKELSEFVKDKNKKDGTRNICKQCYNLAKRKTPIKPVPMSGYKYCCDCGSELPISDFNIRMVAGKKRPFSYCKQCERKRNNNRYKHICKQCGKEYRSGKKETSICSDCKNKKFAELGKKNLEKLNANQSGKNNRMYGVHRYGAENPNYNQDKTDEEREKGRIIDGYKEWRSNVYQRDNYTCQCCGDKSGGNLNAHHLDGYDWCKEKRTSVENGVTLCDKCHIKFHKIYGTGKNTKEQFYKFQNNKEYIDNMLTPR